MRKTLWIIGVLTTVFPFVAYSQSDYSEGKRLYDLKCGRCHFAYPPSKYSSEEWKTIVKEMGPLSGLDENSEAVIFEYLDKESSKKESGALPTSPVLAGYLYTEFFSSQDSTDTFDIHYLNVGLTGRLHERVSYHAEFEFEHGGGEDEPPFVEQAYMDVWLMRNMALRIGAIITPFNRFDDFHAPLENLLITRPQMAREIGVSAWKEVGIDLHGNIILHEDFYINYDAYTINGLGSGSRLRGSRQYRDNNDAKSVGFRLSGIFQDRWELGASYYHGAWDEESELDLNMFGFHFLGRINELDLYAEYSHFSSDNPVPIDKGTGEGLFIQASYLLSERFRPTLRFEILDYLDPGDQLGRKPTDFDKRIFALGLNYYLTPAIVFKFEYDFVMEGDRNLKKDNNLLALQAAARF